MSREERMASASIGSLVVSMAFPAILAQLINILYSIIDRIYIGHMKDVGAAALTGVGVTFCITVFISAFSGFVNSGAAPLAAIWLGKKDREHAEKILGNSVTFLVICTVLLMAFFYAFQKPLLYMLVASVATIGYAVDYISIYLVGTIFVEFALGLNAFIICQSQSRIAMYSVLIGAIANIILDPIFIFVFGLGVKGAAIATVISQALSAVWVVGFLTGKKTSLKIRRKCLRLEKGILISIFSLGISPFIMRATESFMTIMQSVMQIFSAPIGGFTQGISPVISYNYGAGNFARVKEVYRWMIGACFVFMLVSTASTMMFPEWYASFFTEDAELIALVGKTMPVFMFGMSVFGLQNGIQPTFLALGQARISLFIAVLRKVILLIPLAIILPRFFGVMGVYYSEPVSDIISATTATVLFLCNIRKMLSKEALAKIR